MARDDHGQTSPLILPACEGALGPMDEHRGRFVARPSAPRPHIVLGYRTGHRAVIFDLLGRSPWNEAPDSSRGGDDRDRGYAAGWWTALSPWQTSAVAYPRTSQGQPQPALLSGSTRGHEPVASRSEWPGWTARGPLAERRQAAHPRVRKQTPSPDACSTQHIDTLSTGSTQEIMSGFPTFKFRSRRVNTEL